MSITQCRCCKGWFKDNQLIDDWLCVNCYSKSQTQILTTALGEDFVAEMEELNREPEDEN